MFLDEHNYLVNVWLISLFLTDLCTIFVRGNLCVKFHGIVIFTFDVIAIN